MNWIKTIATVLVLCSNPAWGATLTWDANSESDLAGYRVYQCLQLPCTRASGNASTLATSVTATSFNIGTPSVTQHYFVTAYDLSNLESSESSVVTYTPPPVTPVIGVNPLSLSFAAAQGGTNPSAQSLAINNTGSGTLSWSASDNAAWLSLNPSSGTGNGGVTVNVNTGSLAEGRYSASIVINATGASPVTVPVTFTVSSTPPVIGINPTSLSFAATEGAGSPPNQTLSIGNTGGGTLSWSASDNATWLSLSPTSGTGSGVVTVSVNTSSLSTGTYNGMITLTATGAPSVTVPVTVTVNSAPVSYQPPPTPRGLRLGWFK